MVVACAGGGSNAAGIFAGFADATSAGLVAVEAAGGAALTTGIPGVLHGMRSALIQDEAGQILEAESISAGLDYPGIGPEHAHLAELGPRPLRVGGRRARCWRRSSSWPGPRASCPPSSRPTPWPGWSSPPVAGELAPGVDGAGQPVRPGRQGRRPGARHPGGPVVTAPTPATHPPGTLESALRARRDAGHKLLDPLRHRRARRRVAAGARGAGRSRGGRHRSGDPLFRPDDRRPRHPGVVVAGARPGHHPRRGAGRPQPGRRRGAAGGDDVLQPDLPGRARADRRVDMRQVRRVRGDHPRPAPRGGRSAGPRPPTPRMWPPSCWSRRRPRTNASAPSASGPGDSSTPWDGWGSPANRPCWPTRPGRWRGGSGPSPTCRCASASACPPRTRPATVCEVADGVVVGSALVRRSARGGGPRRRRRVRRLAAVRHRRRLTGSTSRIPGSPGCTRVPWSPTGGEHRWRGDEGP